jgi:hypothetical protein
LVFKRSKSRGFYPGFFWPHSNPSPFTINHSPLEPVLFLPTPTFYFSVVVNINLHQPGSLNLTLEFPSSWNELFPEEVNFICKSLLQQTEENANATRALILKFIIDLRTKASRKKLPAQWMNQVDAEQAVMQGYPLLDFIFNKNELTNLPKPIMLIFYLVKLHCQPFREITCGEFEDCEILANRFHEEASAELLANLSAILFRPKKADKLIPYIIYNYKTATYITYKAERKIKSFLKLRPWQLYAAFVYYAGCRNQLRDLFPDVYEGGDSSQPDMMAFTNCIHAAAGPKNGNRNEIRCTKLYEFMYEANQEAIKAKELKEEYDRLNK